MESEDIKREGSERAITRTISLLVRSNNDAKIQGKRIDEWERKKDDY